MSAEASSPGIESGSRIWLTTITKPLTLLQNFILQYIIRANQASSPILPTSLPAPSQQRPDIQDLHPIIRMMREQELGRAVITLAIPIAAWVVASKDGSKLTMAHVVAVGVMMGCMAIWNGILFRASFHLLANILEQVGISLVLLLTYGLVASFLPKWFSWILWLSGASGVAPFIVARFHRT